jgi:tetratricopeptide (TPR) repeat protein
MMRIPCIFALLAAVVSAGLGADSQPKLASSVFDRANASYESGNFNEAETLYRQILDSGIDNGAVFYNLGNACFKQKKVGRAIYYWEKAQQILPRDADVRANLELASFYVVDWIEEPPASLPTRWLRRTVGIFTMEQEGWIVLGLFLTANFLAAVCICARSPSVAVKALVSACAVGLLALVFAASLAWKAYEAKHTNRGVVVAEKVEIRSGPGTDNITVFTLHEGIVLRVHSQVSGWYQVTLPNGWSGWVPSNAVWIL